MRQPLSFFTSVRLDAVDSVKAIAIIAIIVGHTPHAHDIPFLHSLVNSFHVPAFFIIAGFFIHDLPFRQALPKYASRYLWPYAVTCLLLLIRDVAKTIIKGGDVAHTALQSAIKSLWGSGFCADEILFGDLPYVGAIWFLLALFWAELFFSSSLSRFGLLPTALLSVTLYCAGLMAAQAIFLPWSLLPAASAALLMLVGLLIRRYDLLAKAYYLNRWLWVAIAAICVANIVFNQPVSMVLNRMGFNIIGLFCCIAETVGLICLCHRFNIRFKWVGQNTLYILCAHILTLHVLPLHLDSYPPHAIFLISLPINLALSLSVAWLMKRFNILRWPFTNTQNGK